jgi:hypothetical protein
MAIRNQSRRLLILAVALGPFVLLGGCAARQKKPLAAAVPVAPAPVAAPPAAAPAPRAPLSTPQTRVQLPAPQPLSPEAIATTQPPDEPPLPPVVPRAAPRRPAATAPKPEPAAPPVIVPPPAAEPERPPIQEVVPPGDLKRFQEDAERAKAEIRKYIDQVQAHQLSRRQRGLLDRVNSFVKQSDDAQNRGDMRQARELAGRALVLARELVQ